MKRDMVYKSVTLTIARFQQGADAQEDGVGHAEKGHDNLCKHRNVSAFAHVKGKCNCAYPR